MIMKKVVRLLFWVFWVLPAWAQISDEQAVSIMKRMNAQGQSAAEIATTLSQSGITEEQLARIKSRAEDKGARQSLSTDSRLRMIPADTAKLDTIKTERQEEKKLPEGVLPIFGHDIFSSNRLTFEPQVNIATPENYVLGPGDEVIIDIWGNSQQSIRQTISPEGSIVVEPVGMIKLNGLNIAQARTRVRQAFSSVYELDGGTQLNLSLGSIRSIQVHVMGEVEMPGTYTVPSLATLFHVLHSAGGVNDIGSLRDIRVNRGGKQVEAVDVYEYLMHGRSDLDIALKDGDVVLVQPYANLVAVTGKVKRPMRYEMTANEPLGTLLKYAGGFTGDAYTKAVGVERKSGREHSVYNVDESDFGNFKLADLDSISVGAVLDRFANRVEVKGAVFRPGVYALGDDVSTVRELVERAEGLRGDVFAGHAVLYRMRDDYIPEALSLDIGAVMKGEAEDVRLRKDDVLEIPSIFDLNEAYTVSINGQVAAPGTYPWADNLTLEDLIVRAGGMLEAASTVRVDVAQRVKDSASKDEAGVKAINLSFELKNGLVVSGNREYLLRPFDVVYVRMSPGYSVQQNVTVDGEVMFAGEYALSIHGERLSELVRRAGGLKRGAYAEGARLTRLKTEEEWARESSALGLVESAGRDSLDMSDVGLSESYTVAIELNNALTQPGSDYDLVLRKGDKLHIPEYNGTVMVCGAVIYPNTVAYRKGHSVRQYVSNGGGYASRALRRKTYVIHMNGMVEESRFLSRPKVTPGSMVVVPMKREARNPMSVMELTSMTTSIASMGAIVTSLLNMNK